MDEIYTFECQFCTYYCEDKPVSFWDADVSSYRTLFPCSCNSDSSVHGFSRVLVEPKSNCPFGKLHHEAEQPTVAKAYLDHLQMKKWEVTYGISQ